jgi:hypothetical protein
MADCVQRRSVRSNDNVQRISPGDVESDASDTPSFAVRRLLLVSTMSLHMTALSLVGSVSVNNNDWLLDNP